MLADGTIYVECEARGAHHRRDMVPPVEVRDAAEALIRVWTELTRMPNMDCKPWTRAAVTRDEVKAMACATKDLLSTRPRRIANSDPGLVGVDVLRLCRVGGKCPSQCSKCLVCTDAQIRKIVCGGVMSDSPEVCFTKSH